MKKLSIEIFEIKGSSEISTDLDLHILDLHRMYNGGITLRKIDVFNKEQIKGHKDVIDIIKKSGLEALPIIKAGGRIVSEQKLQQMLKEYL